MTALFTQMSQAFHGFMDISAGTPARVRGVRDGSGGSAPHPENSQIGSGIDCCVDDCRSSQSYFRVGIWLVLCLMPSW